MEYINFYVIHLYKKRGVIIKSEKENFNSDEKIYDKRETYAKLMFRKKVVFY